MAKAKAKAAGAPQALEVFDEVELVHYRKLIPADYNPRRITPARMAQLKASLLKFGFTIPIVAERDGPILGGHQRTQSIADLVAAGVLPESQKVPVIWRDGLTPADARKLNVALNEIGGEFVHDEYAGLLREIAEMDGGAIEDLEAMGLTEDDLTALLDSVDVPREQLDRMANEASPGAGAKDRIMVPVKAYKLSVPIPLAEEFVDPALKTFGHDALELLGTHGARIAKFDGHAAAFVAVCRYALRKRREELGEEPEAPAESPEGAPAEEPAEPDPPRPRPRRSRAKAKAGKAPAKKRGTPRRRAKA